MYDLVLRRTTRSILGNTILASHPIVPFFCSRFVVVGLMTNRRFFTDLKNPGHLEEYSETLFDLGEF